MIKLLAATSSIIFLSCNLLVAQSSGARGRVIECEIPYSDLKFDAKLNRNSVRLPDSLRIVNFESGFAVIRIHLTDDGRIEGFNLMKLTLKVTKGAGVEYSQSNSVMQPLNYYPPGICKYFLFLYNSKSDLIVVRKNDTKVQAKNPPLLFLIRFN